MNRFRNKAGFSLIEMLAALPILVFLVLGMGVGMDAGSRIYRDATFEADSATLAGILNTSLGDILRYSTRVKTIDPIEKGIEEDVTFVFTSSDYGIQDAYFVADHTDGALKMKNLHNNNVVALINLGAYPGLEISDFEIHYSERQKPGIEGGYFEVNYKILSANDSEKSRDVCTVIRLMND